MLKCSRRGLWPGMTLPQFFEGLAEGMVRDSLETNIQPTLSLEIFHSWKIPFQRETAFTHTHLATSRLPTLGECLSRTRAWCLKVEDPGNSQHPSSSSRSLEEHSKVYVLGLGLGLEQPGLDYRHLMAFALLLQLPDNLGPTETQAPRKLWVP